MNAPDEIPDTVYLRAASARTLASATANKTPSTKCARKTMVAVRSLVFTPTWRRPVAQKRTLPDSPGSRCQQAPFSSHSFREFELFHPEERADRTMSGQYVYKYDNEVVVGGTRRMCTVE